MELVDPTFLQNLPFGPKLEILSNLDDKTLSKICQLGRDWDQICHDNRLWSNLLMKVFNYHVDREDDRDAYEIYKIFKLSSNPNNPPLIIPLKYQYNKLWIELMSRNFLYQFDPNEIPNPGDAYRKYQMFDTLLNNLRLKSIVKPEYLKWKVMRSSLIKLLVILLNHVKTAEFSDGIYEDNQDQIEDIVTNVQGIHDWVELRWEYSASARDLLINFIDDFNK